MRCRQAIRFHCLEVLTARTPALHVGSADNLGFPLVILHHGALPPDLPAAARGNVPRRQAIVLRWMPFLDKIGPNSCKTVGFGNTVSTAMWTAGALSSSADRSFPFMVVCDRAFPPDSFSAACREIVWTQIAVSRWMPFSYQLRVCGSQAVGSVNFSIRTIRASSSLGPITNYRLPFVAYLASPPNLFVASYRNHIGAQCTIFRRVPLGSELGMSDRQRTLHAIFLSALCGHETVLDRLFACFSRRWCGLCQCIEVHFQPCGQIANRTPGWISSSPLFQVADGGHGNSRFIRQLLLCSPSLLAERSKNWTKIAILDPATIDPGAIHDRHGHMIVVTIRWEWRIRSQNFAVDQLTAETFVKVVLGAVRRSRIIFCAPRPVDIPIPFARPPSMN